MEYSVSRDETRFRGREFTATEADMVAFLDALMPAFPDARLFHDLHSKWQEYQEISVGEVARLFAGDDDAMVIFDPKWKARTRLYENQTDRYNVLNVPLPMVRFTGSWIQKIETPELPQPIRVCRAGILDGQSVRADDDQSRIIDKVLRIHRKHVTKDVLVYDLKTGAVVREDTCTYWFCPDMARRSLEEDDLYLSVGFLPDEGKFYGFKARQA